MLSQLPKKNSFSSFKKNHEKRRVILISKQKREKRKFLEQIKDKRFTFKFQIFKSQIPNFQFQIFIPEFEIPHSKFQIQSQNFMFKISSCKFSNLKFQKFQVANFQNLKFQNFKMQSFKISSFKLQNLKFQVSSCKEKNIFQGTTKIHQGFLANDFFFFQIKKEQRKITMEQQSPHHLKSNPKFWLFATDTQIKVKKPFDQHSNHSDQSWKALWSTFQQLKSKLRSPLIDIPITQIKVEKPFGRHNSSFEVEKSLGHHSYGYEVENPLVTFHQDRGCKANRSPQLWFRGWKTLWLPFIKIEVEKPFGHHNFASKVEKPPSYLSSRSRLKIPLVAIAPVSRLKSPLVTFHQDRDWKVPWSLQLWSRGRKALWLLSIFRLR